MGCVFSNVREQVAVRPCRRSHPPSDGSESRADPEKPSAHAGRSPPKIGLEDLAQPKCPLRLIHAAPNPHVSPLREK